MDIVMFNEQYIVPLYKQYELAITEQMNCLGFQKDSFKQYSPCHGNVQVMTINKEVRQTRTKIFMTYALVKNDL